MKRIGSVPWTNSPTSKSNSPNLLKTSKLFTNSTKCYDKLPNRSWSGIQSQNHHRISVVNHITSKLNSLNQIRANQFVQQKHRVHTLLKNQIHPNTLITITQTMQAELINWQHIWVQQSKTLAYQFNPLRNTYCQPSPIDHASQKLAATCGHKETLQRRSTMHQLTIQKSQLPTFPWFNIRSIPHQKPQKPFLPIWVIQQFQPNSPICFMPCDLK